MSMNSENAKLKKNAKPQELVQVNISFIPLYTLEINIFLFLILLKKKNQKFQTSKLPALLALQLIGFPLNMVSV